MFGYRKGVFLFRKMCVPISLLKTSYPLKKTEGYHDKEQDLHLWLMNKWQMQTQTFFPDGCQWQNLTDAFLMTAAPLTDHAQRAGTHLKYRGTFKVVSKLCPFKIVQFIF